MNYQPNIRQSFDKLKPDNAGNLSSLRELRQPLDNIYLSIAMFQTVIERGDQEIYLDVITRNVVRLEQAVSKMLANSQAVSITRPTSTEK